jgi:hypothetical protein
MIRFLGYSLRNQQLCVRFQIHFEDQLKLNFIPICIEKCKQRTYLKTLQICFLISVCCISEIGCEVLVLNSLQAADIFVLTQETLFQVSKQREM